MALNIATDTAFLLASKSSDRNTDYAQSIYGTSDLWIAHQFSL